MNDYQDGELIAELRRVKEELLTEVKVITKLYAQATGINESEAYNCLHYISHLKEKGKYKLPDYIAKRITEDIGHASMCWHPLPTNEVFDSELAAKIAKELCEFIANEMIKI
jgi:hypothetical protein